MTRPVKFDLPGDFYFVITIRVCDEVVCYTPGS